MALNSISSCNTCMGEVALPDLDKYGMRLVISYSHYGWCCIHVMRDEWESQQLVHQDVCMITELVK